MEDFREKTISAIKWTYLSTFIARGLYPIILIFLARLLTPADFGLVAMGMVVITFFSCFSDFGLKHALIQQKGNNEKIANVAFSFLLVAGFIWFLVIWLIAPYVGSYYRNTEIISLLRVLGLVFIVYPFSDVPLSLMLRELDFKALFFRQLLPQIFSGSTSIVMALKGYGAWALVFGYLSGAIGTSLVVNLQSKWRPALSFNKDIFREMFRFGSFMTIQSILGWMMVRVDNLFVGRFLGASNLGIYRIAFTYGYLPWQLIGLPFYNFAYPFFCKMNGNLKEFRDKYILYLKWISIASVPTGVAFVFLIPFVIPVLLGHKWLQALPVLQIIAITSILSSISGLNLEVYKAIGKPHISAKFFTIRVLVSLPFYYYAAQKSIITLAFMHMGLACLFVPINFFICSKVLTITYFSIFKNIMQGFLVGITLTLTGLVYNSYIKENLIYNPLGNALLLLVIFFGVGSISLFTIDKEAFKKLLQFIKNGLRYKAPEVTM